MTKLNPHVAVVTDRSEIEAQLVEQLKIYAAVDVLVTPEEFQSAAQNGTSDYDMVYLDTFSEPRTGKGLGYEDASGIDLAREIHQQDPTLT